VITACFAASGLFLLLLLVGVARDRRRFGNAVYLGLSVAFLALGLLAGLLAHPSVHAKEVLVAVVVLPALGVVLLGVALVANGVQMVRREGRGLGNLLSLAAGLGLLGTLALAVVALAVQGRALGAATAAVLLVVGYVSFLFLCFLGYAFLYGRMPVRRRADAVVVLGSGLVGGDQVPPLLASRLERGLRVYRAQTARGRRPLLVASGGQGPDEDLPESHAMADHLRRRGVPEADLRREDRSRTTEENLAFTRELLDAEVAAGRLEGRRCIVVTNNYHVFRAALMAHQAGVDGQVVGAPTAAYFWPSATLREFAAVFLAHKAVNFGLCAVLAVLAALAVWQVG
jgi:uncharacterized SAM-binding protein YcdF (DUF218 family)